MASLTSTGLISQYLDTNGDGTGTTNANGDYSSALDEFYIEPASDETYLIARIIISVEDTAGMTAEEYGNLGSALTNGVEIQERDGTGVVTDFTDGVPIKANFQWGALCYDVDIKSWGTTPTNELLVARYSFNKFGDGVTVTGELGERLTVRLNDDFTGLISHRFMVQGEKFERS